MPEVDDNGNPINPATPPANVEGVNERLLAESKANKQRNKELQARLDAIEKSKLEEEGKYKELLDKEKKEKEELQSSISASNQKVLKANIRATIAKFATDVVDMDDLMNQPKFKKIIEEGLDGDELTLSDEAAQKYVKAVYEAKPHLKKVVATPGTHKGGKPTYNGKDQEKDYKDMSAAEKAKYRRALLTKED